LRATTGVLQFVTFTAAAASRAAAVETLEGLAGCEGDPTTAFRDMTQ
jgi:hypothetical protein